MATTTITINQFNPSNPSLTLPPLSVYIHLPWCVKKCPYCDFNSHALKTNLPEQAYIDCLLTEFKQYLPQIQGRTIHTIFFGGGTPSLFSAEKLGYLLENIHKLATISRTVEITLEANPGTMEHQRFQDYRAVGINRISLGIQSFQSDKLQALGRIHSAKEAQQAITMVKAAKFPQLNIDIMHGLPEQTIDDGLFDLTQAIGHEPQHISWYQLTLEPNTVFYQRPPVLPTESVLAEIEQQGFALLKQHDYERYEVSAYAKSKAYAQHNVNYWRFGDYLGLGAGAHSKITQYTDKLTIHRHWNYRSPYSYMKAKLSKPENPHYYIANQKQLSQAEICFEYMLNRLRLMDKLNLLEFEQYTGLDSKLLAKPLALAIDKNLISQQDQIITKTALGNEFLDDLCQLFLS